jgi:DNA-directed RNA polymerase subunit F
LEDFSSWAFGTATSKQVSEVKDMLSKVETMAETAAADASRTREGLATFTKLSNERIDKLHDILKIQQKSIGQLYREILDTAELVQDEYSTST